MQAQCRNIQVNEGRANRSAPRALVTLAPRAYPLPAMKTIIIGDIHGCFDELLELLATIGAAEEDRVVSVGDLIDRGPKPVEVVRFFRDRPGALALRGNHEDKHLRIATGELTPAPSQALCKVQCGEAYDEILAYIATLPMYLDLPEAIVVHAGFDPNREPDQQLPNVLMRARWPGMKFGGDPVGWTARYQGEKPLVYGHTVFETPRVVGRTFGIDTGACHGQHLTAFVLPEGRLVSVAARENYWLTARQGGPA